VHARDAIEGVIRIVEAERTGEIVDSARRATGSPLQLPPAGTNLMAAMRLHIRQLRHGLPIAAGAMAAIPFATGCGGRTAREASSDAAIDVPVGGPDANSELATEAAAADQFVGDVLSLDAGGVSVTAPDGACNCRPFPGDVRCGSSTMCNPAYIGCTAYPGLSCSSVDSSTCPELQQVTCTCSGGRCVRSGLDAAIGCSRDLDCPPGDCCGILNAGAICVPAPNICCPENNPRGATCS
jgi:hypothetical protein